LIKEELIKELDELIASYLSRQNLELIELICRYEGNNLVLRILADRPEGHGLASSGQSHRQEGGITLGECALANRQLSELLEEKNIIEGNYVLEVSSPGLDRCLKRQKDFLRCLNKEAVFFLNDLVGGKCQWQGVISKVDDQSVFIGRPQGHGLASDSQSHNAEQLLEIPLIKINKARLVI